MRSAAKPGSKRTRSSILLVWHEQGVFDVGTGRNACATERQQRTGMLSVDGSGLLVAALGTSLTCLHAAEGPCPYFRRITNCDYFLGAGAGAGVWLGACPGACPGAGAG